MKRTKRLHAFLLKLHNPSTVTYLLQKMKLCKKDTFKNLLKFSNFIVWITTNVCCFICQTSLLMYRYG